MMNTDPADVVATTTMEASEAKACSGASGKKSGKKTGKNGNSKDSKVTAVDLEQPKDRDPIQDRCDLLAPMMQRMWEIGV